MSFKETFEVPKNHQITINIPSDFSSKQKVVVTVEGISISKNEKMKMMKRAAKDKLYLQDLKEVNNDFENINNEGL